MSKPFLVVVVEITEDMLDCQGHSMERCDLDTLTTSVVPPINSHA